MCVSVCLHLCLWPSSCGIVTKCWLHTWQTPLPACLAFWGFQALRIPPWGFFSPSSVSVLSFSAPPPPFLFSPFTVTGFCGSRISLFPKWVADVFLESPIVWWRGSPSLFFTPLRPPSPAEPSYPATRPSRYDLHGSTSQQPVSLESFPFKLAIY